MTTDSFQKQISKDIKNIRKDKKVFIAADKTTNSYKVTPETYDNLLNQNIQKDYKKTTNQKANTLLKTDIKIAKNVDRDDRIEVSAKSEAYITLKDHKEHFRTNQKWRLINPNKSNIGKISKKILQKVNTTVRTKLNLNQWRSTQDVISWFKAIQNKQKGHFIQFDICDFYPSISVELISDALNWAQEFTTISTLDREIIMAAKNTLLYNDSNPWCKKNPPNFFDVTMGSFDGAESCELIGLFILQKITKFDVNLGLYRDDGLGFSQKSRKQIDNLKKQIEKTFNDLVLNITIYANLLCVDFLDVTFELLTGLHNRSWNQTIPYTISTPLATIPNI